MQIIKLFITILKDFSLLNPNVIVTNVSYIDYKALSSLGVRYLVFDKDNTLSETYAFKYYKPGIQKAVYEAKTVFGMKNIAILSNSIKKEEFHWIFEQEPVSLIGANSKKPFNFTEIQRHFNNAKAEEIAVIGDRLMTDTLLANLNGGISIYVKPLETTHEKINIKLMRRCEDSILKRFGRKRREHGVYNKESLGKIEIH